MKQAFTNASCPNCNTEFANVPVDYDELGGYAALEVRPCASEDCDTLLCACCPRFHCEGCAGHFCLIHAVEIFDEPGRPIRYCPACAADIEVEETIYPTPFPPSRETRPSHSSVEVA